jgi:Uma2 family endonuclease
MGMLQVMLEVPEEGVLTIRPDAISRQAYRTLCAAHPDLRIEREANGEVNIMAPAHSRSSNRNFRIALQFGNWALSDGTGECYDSSAGFDLPNGANRSPDVSWVNKERLRALPPLSRDEFLPLCPDFVIEVRSSTDRLPALQAKMAEYLDNGARLGWLIDPIKKRVWVYRPGSAVELLQEPDSISGDPELPGFTLQLDPIWNPEF